MDTGNLGLNVHMKIQPLGGFGGMLPRKILNLGALKLIPVHFGIKMRFCMVEIESSFTIMSRSMKNILLIFPNSYTSNFF